MNVVAAGDRGLLVELGEVTAAELHDAAARVRTVPEIVACIAGHSSLYTIWSSAPSRDALSDALARSGTSAGIAAGATHHLRVRFDPESGPDLPELLQRVSLESFLERVATLRLTVRYIGFRGGFGYLDGWPEEWAMPRRPTSRPFVPRGTFGVAGAVAGFYPIDSPGGWNLLGRTESDLEHALVPGDTIVIEPLGSGEAPAGSGGGGGEGAASPAGGAPALPFEVLSGPLTRVVGPPAWSGIERGIPPGGPFDDLAAALANRAVGNAPGAPLLECAMAGPRIRMRRDVMVAWCGPDLRVVVRRASAGEEVVFGRISGGLRAYVAAGDAAVPMAKVDRGDRLRIRALSGPHAIEPGEIACEVTPHLDRVGIRLQPLRALGVEAPSSMRSIGMQCGTVQLHPDGSLVAMGPDHPVTGGYLQPLTVLSTERWKLAQLVPGERVVFVGLSYPPKAYPDRAVTFRSGWLRMLTCTR